MNDSIKRTLQKKQQWQVQELAAKKQSPAANFFFGISGLCFLFTGYAFFDKKHSPMKHTSVMDGVHGLLGKEAMADFFVDWPRLQATLEFLHIAIIPFVLAVVFFILGRKAKKAYDTQQNH